MKGKMVTKVNVRHNMSKERGYQRKTKHKDKMSSRCFIVGEQQRPAWTMTCCEKGEIRMGRLHGRKLWQRSLNILQVFFKKKMQFYHWEQSINGLFSGYLSKSNTLHSQTVFQFRPSTGKQFFSAQSLTFCSKEMTLTTSVQTWVGNRCRKQLSHLGSWLSVISMASSRMYKYRTRKQFSQDSGILTTGESPRHSGCRRRRIPVLV